MAKMREAVIRVTVPEHVYNRLYRRGVVVCAGDVTSDYIAGLALAADDRNKRSFVVLDAHLEK